MQECLSYCVAYYCSISVTYPRIGLHKNVVKCHAMITDLIFSKCVVEICKGVPDFQGDKLFSYFL